MCYVPSHDLRDDRVPARMFPGARENGLLHSRLSFDVDDRNGQCIRTDTDKNLIVRQNPTTNKIRYLVHLEDCCESAHEGVVHGLRVLDCLAKWIDTQQMTQTLWCAGESFQSRLASLQSDLDFFRDQFTKVGKEIKEVQQTLYEHLNMTHNRRNFILTIIAAVNLPLSFAATLFGMNINNTTSTGPQGFSNWTASWIDSSLAEIQNSTVSTVGSSGPLTYDWKIFFITAACLLVSIPFSLTIGGILRLAYRSTTHYVTYWRIFAVFPNVAFIFFSIFGNTPPPSIPWLYLVCNSLLFSFMAFRATRTRSLGNNYYLWIAMAIMLSLSLTFAFKFVPLMLIPWLLIGWT